MSKHLFQEFDEVPVKQWKQKIQYDLNGADYNETLIWKTREEIDVKPFYTPEDLTGENTGLHPETWSIQQDIYVAREILSNEKALEYTNRGAESIGFILPSDQTDFRTLLNNFPFEQVPVYFYPEFLSVPYLIELQNFLAEKKATGYISLDPIAKLAKTGNWQTSLTDDFKALEAVIKNNVAFPVYIDVQSGLYHNAGATVVQQLAYALAHANEYLTYFSETEGLSPLNVGFQVSVGSNYFFEISKIRALRMLWKTLATEYGVRAECHIHARPGKRNKTLYDYNVNMLRSTTECMSAILGGANNVTNTAYDVLFHKDNEFGNRIARNQLLILKHESYFDLVSNAAEGTYYIESLTHQLAEKALELFKSLEAGGGFLNQLKEHTIQKKIKESAAEEQELFNTGKLVLLGTNKYPNPQDVMKYDLELYPFVKHEAKKTLIEPIIEKRLAEFTEKTRLENEK